jgi:hypothetical protein
VNRRRVLIRTAVAVAGVAGVVALGLAIGKDGSGATVPLPAPVAKTRPTVPRPARARPAGCPKLGRSRPLPADFQRSFPLPPTATIDRVRRFPLTGHPPIVYVYGAVPGALRNGVAFFVRELPLHGYYLGTSDAEAHEAESKFGGHGLTGAWKLVSFPRCPGILGLAVGVVRPA